MDEPKNSDDDLYDFTILTICPDFGEAWAWIGNRDHPDFGIPVGCGGDWCGRRNLPNELVVRCANWQRIFESAPWDNDSYLRLNWDDFHLEGMKLSAEIKASLGEDILVIYQKAFEDEHAKEPLEVEVLADGSLRPMQ